MPMISPILQNTITPKTNLTQHHEKAYQDLQKRANEVKPNEAKAKMVEEGMLGDPIAATADVLKDCKNFKTAVKTGQMGDNNLGRINDLGLKIGAGIIATFLALHSKTKKESLMRFIGGATFIGAMSLWPKIFINIPARLVHGFRIDRKYISAQGDKKDFGLDNQFYVWDAYPEKQLRKDAKRAGIDYDAPNGKEKIQRKIQKTTLQNRTLGMATAGFATPLMTAMICNFIEPEVEKAIVERGVKKASKNINDIQQYMRNCTPQVQNQGDIQNALNEIGKTQDFTKLAEILTPRDVLKKFKDPDAAKPLLENNPSGFAEELKKIYGKLVTFNPEDLDLSGVKSVAEDAAELFDESCEKASDSFDLDKLKAEFRNFGKTCSLEEARETLKGAHLIDQQVEDILSKVTTDESRFKGFIKEFNEGPVALLRSRLKAYTDILNPIVGSTAESAYTLEINGTLERVFKTLGLDKNIKDLRKGLARDDLSIMSKAIQKAVENSIKKGGDSYQELIASLCSGNVGDDIQKLVDALKDTANIKKLALDFETSYEGIDMDALTRALFGGDDEHGLVKLFSSFVKKKEFDINAIKTKAVICANFERRLKYGDLDFLMKDEHKNLLQIAREMIYDGVIPSAENGCEASNILDTKDLVTRIFNRECFAEEQKALPNGIHLTKEGGIIDNLAAIFRNEKDGELKKLALTPDEKYFSCGSFTSHMKNLATKIGNNKAWKKIFVPMAIILVAVTLLIQPMFGKIDKEFPDETKAGGKK